MDDIDKICALALAANWRPIESAPKDGTRILVCAGPDDEHPEIVEWSEPGWYNGDWTYDPEDFTHWMPLPASPKTEG